MRFISNFFLLSILFIPHLLLATSTEVVKNQLLFDNYFKTSRRTLLIKTINPEILDSSILSTFKDYQRKLKGKIPNHLLSSIIHWKIVNPNKKNLQKTLTFYFLIKLHAFKNYDESTSFIKKENEKRYNESKVKYLQALGVPSLDDLKKFLSIKEIMENHGELLSLIEDHQKFISNILKHPLIRQGKFLSIPLDNFIFISPFQYMKETPIHISSFWEKDLYSHIQFSGNFKDLLKKKFGLESHLKTPSQITGAVRPIYSENGLPYGINDLLIDQLNHAKRKIFIESETLTDPDIIETLIKEKLKRPNLKIQIILNSKSNGTLIGLPNNIFLDKLAQYKIGVRVKEPSSIINNFILLDDDRTLILNKPLSYKTVKNSNHFLGYQIISKKLADKVSQYFIQEWNHPKKIFELNIKDFETSDKKNTYNKKETRIISNMMKKFLRTYLGLKNRP